MSATATHQFTEIARFASFQAATPIVLALSECDPELREQAMELFHQLASGKLDDSERYSTVALIADILFPESDELGFPGIDSEVEDAEEADEDDQNQIAHFLEAIKQLMQQRGLSQSELAEKVGIGQSSISMMLKRHCRPQRSTIKRLAVALDVQPDQLWPAFQD